MCLQLTRKVPTQTIKHDRPQEVLSNACLSESPDPASLAHMLEVSIIHTLISLSFAKLPKEAIILGIAAAKVS